MNRHERREQLDDEIAERLRAGATHQAIVDTLNVGHTRVVRVRAERRIALPPGRTRPTPDELRARDEKATEMLRAGATCQQIRNTTGAQLDRIVALRKQHRIPVPDRRPAPAPTLDAPHDATFHPGATP